MKKLIYATLLTAGVMMAQEQSAYAIVFDRNQDREQGPRQRREVANHDHEHGRGFRRQCLERHYGFDHQNQEASRQSEVDHDDRFEF